MKLQGYELGIQSWTFRAFRTLDDCLNAVAACGLSAVELCDVHLDVRDACAVDEGLGKCRAAGIAVTSFGISHFPNDEAVARPRFEFARKAGFRALGADPDPDALPMLDRLCAEYGVRLAIHNHGRHHRYGFPETLEAVFLETSMMIGLCLDTAWALDAHLDPVQLATTFSDRLYGVHLKDFVFDAAGNHQDVIVGTGALDVPKFLATLDEVEFNGYLTLEYEGNVENPLPDARACVEHLRALTDTP
jgi:sugar phosphate isomerase/epimerase